MRRVTTPPSEEARTIFSDLGYAVDGDGEEFRASRDWKEVRVTALADPSDAPETADAEALQCYVVWDDRLGEFADAVDDGDRDDLAVIGVRENGDYEVAQAPGPTEGR